MDGWLWTGDAARRDQDGFVWIMDRVADRATYQAPAFVMVEDRAGTVLVELLTAATGSLGPGLGAFLRLRAAGLRPHLLEAMPASSSRRCCHATAGLDASCDGRSHSDARVGCIVSSATASNSAVRVSRSSS